MWKSLVILAMALALVQLVEGMSMQGHRGHGRNRPQKQRTAMKQNQNAMGMEDDAPAEKGVDDLGGDDLGGDDMVEDDVAEDDIVEDDVVEDDVVEDDVVEDDVVEDDMDEDDVGGDNLGGDDLGEDGNDDGTDGDEPAMGGEGGDDLVDDDPVDDDLGGDDLGGDNLGGDNTGGDDLGGDNLGGDGTGGDDLGPLGPDDPVEGGDGVTGGEGNNYVKPDEPSGPETLVPPTSNQPRGLPARAVFRMIGLLRRAANHRRNAEQELLKVGTVLAKNGFAGRHSRPEMILKGFRRPRPIPAMMPHVRPVRDRRYPTRIYRRRAQRRGNGQHYRGNQPL